MDFKILIECAYLELGAGALLNPGHNKSVLSIVNDYEEGGWRYEKFENFVWDNIAETALSSRERAVLQGQPASILRNAAKNLRLTDSVNDIGRGSELAEIVLYGIMKHKYKALPVVPKIFYKQNTNDNAKGADSVHIVVDGETFSLWFGESKFYKGIEDARLESIVESVANALQTEKLRKENSIITNVSDIDNLGLDEKLKESIKASLSHKVSIDEIKPKINVPILLLHQCEITAGESSLAPEYIKKISDFHKDRAAAYFVKQLKSLQKLHGYEAVKFHLILFPVPSKKIIVDRFIKTVQFQKGVS